MKPGHKKIRFSIILFVVLAAAWIVFIWGNSLRTAPESVVQSEGVRSLLMPLFRMMKISPETFPVRKLAHVTEYAVLGLIWLGVMRFNYPSAALGLCLVTALADETIQIFVPGRGAEFQDIVLDMSGAVISVSLVFIAVYSYRQRKVRN